ncbi:hypothetical protein QWI18_24475, partial [Pseudomonas sp. W2Oct36]|uniref:hypothetical protein n=1 Tax=Pseudomonas sp. W2Oct36 TaxID=1215284 RepID=UPI0034E07446
MSGSCVVGRFWGHKFNQIVLGFSEIKLKIKVKVKSVCLGADCFAFGELLGKAPQVTKGACSWFG